MVGGRLGASGWAWARLGGLAVLVGFLVVLPRAAQARGDPEEDATRSEAPKDNGAAIVGLPPKLHIPIQLSGYFWVDTGYMQRTNAKQGQYDQHANYMQGRFVLGGSYVRRVKSFYGLAKVQLIGFVNDFTKSQYEAHVLDSFVQAGQRWWDLQIGRFLAWEVYSRGPGIELFTAEEAGALGGPALYWLDYVRGYEDEAGQAAAHLYLFDFLGFEVAGIYGQQSNQNNLGIRPVFNLHRWGLELTGGYEYLAQLPQTEADKVKVTSQGYAGKLQYNGRFVTVAAEAAHANVEYIDIQGLVDGDKTLHKATIGGFVVLDFWRNAIGLGYHYTDQKNKQREHNLHHQAFVSYLFRLPIEGLSLKAVFGYAQAHIEDIDTHSSWTNRMTSFRLRVGYEFR